MRFLSSALALAITTRSSFAFAARTTSAAVNASSAAAFAVNSQGSARPLSSSSTSSNNSNTSLGAQKNTSSHEENTSMTMVDRLYPGTAMERLRNVHARVKQLTRDDLFGDWETVVRRKLLWAGGLKDLPNSIPGQGYTGHAFNDYNHVDLTCMNDVVSDNENDGAVRGIAVGNRLGPGIRVASLEELGPGGSWSTCSNGSNLDPPQDVAHVQFQSRIAFKLVWAPTPNYDEFVLVDDDGKRLAHGKPTGVLPDLRQRQMNFKLVQGSKYAVEAEKIAKEAGAATE